MYIGRTNPPIPPARRLQSHPPHTTSTNAVPSSGTLSPPGALAIPNHSGTEKGESRSAPSSPTEHSKPLPLPPEGHPLPHNVPIRGSPQRSPQNRPKSVIVDSSSKVSYMQVAFAPASNPPAPRPRRDTQYIDVVPQNLPEVPNSHPPAHSPPSTSTQQTQDKKNRPNVVSDAERLSPLSPSSDGVYDIPPPPVPSRPFEVDSNPFSVDPFTGSPVLEDPSAFYDKVPSPRPAPVAPTPLHSNMTIPEVPEQDSITSRPSFEDDFTGGSAYEDTSEFLRMARREDPDERMPASRMELFVPAVDIYQNVNTTEREEDGALHYDVPPVCSRMESNPDDDETGSDGGACYDFPTALSKHPHKPDQDGSHSQEEPAMHPLSYVSKTGGPSMNQHLSNSDPHPPSRADMPLPPLPSNHNQGATAGPKAPPPLPARPPVMTHTLSQKKAPPVHPSRSDPPPLPPYNPRRPQQQQQQQGAPSVEEHPPVPPRKKATNGNTSPPNSSSPRSTLERARGGGGNTTREDIIMELCSLGYSRSDIVRALAVAGNDYQLAKLILKEFGTR